jgi:hypothetical protein
VLHLKPCIICKREKPSVGIGTFAKCCHSCARKLYKRDLRKLGLSPDRVKIAIEEFNDAIRLSLR